MNSEQHAQAPSGVTLELPDEILGQIFLLNTGDDVFDEPHDGLRNLLQTSLVCKQWYAIALGYPLLWSRVINYEKDRIECIEELLKRSSPSFLHIGAETVFNPVSLHNPRAKNVLRSVLQYRARIKTLNLKIRLSPWSFISKNFLQQPAPNLEFLSVVTASPFPDCYHDGPLFANEAPLLRKLHMERCYTDFSAPVLHNLTELSVSGITPPNHNPRWSQLVRSAPTPLGWLQVLQSIPSLQYLTLSNSISKHVKSEAHSNISIELNHLRLLSIVTHFEEGAALIDHLQLSTSCGVRVRLTSSGRPPHDGMLVLLRSLSRQLSSWKDDTSGRYLQAKILDGNRIHFGNNPRIGLLWNKTEAEELQEHSQTSSDPLVWLILCFQNTRDTLNHFDQLFELYSRTLPSTTSFDFWYDEHSRRPQISFQPFTSLKSLNLLGSSASDVLHGLTTSTSDILPSLQTLRLTRVPLDMTTIYLPLIHFLEKKQDSERPLVEVHFIDSQWDIDLVRPLKEKYKVKVTLSSSALQVVQLDHNDSSEEDEGV